MKNAMLLVQCHKILPVFRRRFIPAFRVALARCIPPIRLARAPCRPSDSTPKSQAYFRDTALAVVTAFLFAGFNALAEEAIDVGSRKQLFIDERFIAENDGMTLTVNPARTEEVVLRPERPWENKRVGVYSSVAEYDGKYMMWYDASSFESRNICYAESDDGVHWRRPVTNVVEFEGSTENNIVLKNAVGAVFLDANGKPEERFKFVGRGCGGGGVTVGTSPDGIHWECLGMLLPFNADTQNQGFWDGRIDKYVAYLRAWTNNKRSVARVEMEDITEPWPHNPPRGSSGPPAAGRTYGYIRDRELPTVLTPDELDPSNSDLYNPSVVKYPGAEDAYLAFPSLFRHYSGTPISTILSKELGGRNFPEYRIQLHNENGRVSTAFWTANKAKDQASLMSQDFLQPSRWYHLAATYDGASYRMYIDGVEALYHVRKIPDSSATPYSGTNPLYIGAAANKGGAFRNTFSGTIDEVRIYHRGLSTAEVEAYYQQTAALVRAEGEGEAAALASDEALAAYWKFDEGEGEVAQDFSGHGNTASLQGSFRWSQGLGGALALGRNGYVDCGRTPELDLHEQDFTIMIWIKTPPGFASPDNPQTIDSDLVEIQMATSRDGIHWKRLDRKPYVGLELDGTSLSGSIYMGVGMLKVGNEIYQYYGGSKFTHAVGATNEPGDAPRGAFRRVVQRLDGFMSADAPYGGGAFTTPPITFSGNRLVLNINASAAGTAKVAILDPEGNPFRGFGLDDCDLIGRNRLRKLVTWGGNPDLSTLRGATVRLKFEMRAAKLYSFQFEEFEPVTAVSNELAATRPQRFALEQNYPNPFNSTTAIRYALPEPAEVQLTIYNATGQRVKRLLEGYQEPGYYRVTWDGTDEHGQEVANGLYLYRLASEEFVQNRRMVLLK